MTKPNRTRCLLRSRGFLKKRVREANLADIPDPRRRQGRRWKLGQILNAALAAMMAGCKSTAEVEEVTEWMSPQARKDLGVPRRLPDTTLRDVLCQLPQQPLRAVLHRTVRKARRRKALKPHTLPFHMVSMDGKATAMPYWDDTYCQRHQVENSLPYGLLRTVTSSLVTAPGRICIDVSPIPATTNEMGHFQTAFGELHETYGNLFRMVSYDAGANGEHNARFVVEHDKHYLFRLNNERWHMQQLAQELLDTKPIAAERTDTIDNRKHVVRTLRVFPVNHTNLAPVPGKATIWSHARCLLRTDSHYYEDGVIVRRQTRYYIGSLPHNELTARQWLDAIVLHWGVEITHQTLDVAFEEDARPWIKSDSTGALAAMILRRIACTLMSLWRSMSLRSEENRTRPWRELLRWCFASLIAMPDVRIKQTG